MKKLIITLLILTLGVLSFGQITYPVDVINDRFDVYSISAGEVIATKMKWPRADGMPLAGGDPDKVPLMRVLGDEPTFDPATERLTGYTQTGVDLVAETSIYTRQVVPLSPEEVEDRAQTEADRAELEAIKRLHNALRDGVGNNATRLARVERVLARLLRELNQ